MAVFLLSNEYISFFFKLKSLRLWSRMLMSVLFTRQVNVKELFPPQDIRLILSLQCCWKQTNPLNTGSNVGLLCFVSWMTKLDKLRKHLKEVKKNCLHLLENIYIIKPKYLGVILLNDLCEWSLHCSPPWCTSLTWSTAFHTDSQDHRHLWKKNVKRNVENLWNFDLVPLFSLIYMWKTDLGRLDKI